MSSGSTHLEHDLVNILASMTLNIPQYPRHFYEAGYDVEFIEREFNVFQDGRDKEVKFDIVLNNMDKNHSLACECKSGGTELEQLEKYHKLTSVELVNIGGVASSDPTLHTHDIVIVCNDCNKERVKSEVDSFSFPQIAVTKEPTSVFFYGHKIQDDDLEEFIAEPIPYPDLIYEVFRVNGQTHLFKYISLISVELVSLSRRGIDSFQLSDIVPGVISYFPGLFPAKIGRQMRIDVEAKVAAALHQGSIAELRDFYRWDKRAKKGELKKLKSGCKPNTYIKFRELASALSERIRKGEPIPQEYLKKSARVDPSQLAIPLETDS